MPVSHQSRNRQPHPQRRRSVARGGSAELQRSRYRSTISTISGLCYGDKQFRYCDAVAHSERSGPAISGRVDVVRAGPSQTALTAAAARAAHLLVDSEPWIFADPLAARLLGERAGELLSYHRTSGTHPVLAGARGQVTCRSRYAEDRL